MRSQFKLSLIPSSLTGYFILIALFAAVVSTSLAFNLRSEFSELLSLTVMFGYLGLRRRLKKSRISVSAAA